MSTRKRTLQSKFVVVAGTAVVAGLVLAVGVSVVGAQRIREQSALELERELREASHELVKKQLDSTSGAIERLIGPTLADLGTLTDVSQRLYDRADAPPGRIPVTHYRTNGDMRISEAAGPWVVGVFGDELAPDDSLTPGHLARLSRMAPLEDVVPALQKNGSNKLQTYYLGPKGETIILMAPFVDVAAVWHELYPEARGKPFWDYFFPGLMEHWSRSIADPATFEAVRAAPVMWPPYEDAAGGGLIVTFFRPVWTADRKGLEGAAAIDITLTELVSVISKTRLGHSGFAFLVEGNGNVLAVSEEGARTLGLRTGADGARGLRLLERFVRTSSEAAFAALDGHLPTDDETHFQELSLGGEPFMIALRRKPGVAVARSAEHPVQESWTVGVALPLSEVNVPLLASQAVIARTSRSVVTAQLVIAGLTVIALLVGIFVVSRRMTAPLAELTSAAREIQKQNYDVVVPDAGTDDEIAELTSAFQGMVSQARQHTTQLETQVAERTADLNRTLASLWSEMDLARKIQTVLLPGQHDLVDYDVAATMTPASNVGGDYYDYFRAGGAQWVMIGDVSGHGVSSGLVMMMMQTAIRATAGSLAQRAVPTPSEVLVTVNAAMRENLKKIGNDKYMTVTALQLRPDGIQFSGLHQDMLIFRRARGVVERVETAGVWVGVLDDIQPFLEDSRLTLDSGDVLLLYTDGVTEARRDGQMIGLEGLEAALIGAATRFATSRGVVDGVMASLALQANEDDVTLMAVTRR